MKCYVVYNTGEKFKLPLSISWNFKYGTGSPWDSFEVKLDYVEGMSAILSKACRFEAEHNGVTVFKGIIDECESVFSRNEYTVTISGRSLAAVLLDNEAESREYISCSLSDILNTYVKPLGIKDIKADKMNSVSNFSVSSGTSCMKVLSDFTHNAGGVTPYFSKDGELILTKDHGETYVLSQRTTAYEVRMKDSRYGVISHVTVKNRVNGTETTVKNDEFINMGGLCRRVINVPRTAGYDAMRYTGKYQIEKSMEERRICEIYIHEPFAAFPGDKIKITGTAYGINGTFTVKETETWAQGKDCGTKIRLKI